MDYARWGWRGAMVVPVAYLAHTAVVNRDPSGFVVAALVWLRLEFMDNGIQGAWQNIGVVSHQIHQILAVLRGPKPTGPMVHKPGGVPIPGIRKVN